MTLDKRKGFHVDDAPDKPTPSAIPNLMARGKGAAFGQYAMPAVEENYDDGSLLLPGGMKPTSGGIARNHRPYQKRR